MSQEEHTMLIARSNLKTTMLKFSFCDYSDTYIFVKGKITTTGAGDDTVARRADE